MGNTERRLKTGRRKNLGANSSTLPLTGRDYDAPHPQTWSEGFSSVAIEFPIEFGSFV